MDLGDPDMAQIDQDRREDVKLYSLKIKEIDKVILRAVKGDKEIDELFALLTSIPGVGSTSASTLIVATLGFTRFSSPKALCTFCGVAPQLFESGTSVYQTPHRSLKADPEYASLLYLVAMAALRSSKRMKEYHDRKHKEGKPFLLIVNNIKNKLLTIMFYIAKNKTLYNDDYVSKAFLQDPAA